MRLRLISIAVASAILIAGYLGWAARGWKAEADEAREARLVQRAVDAFHVSEERAAKRLEDSLAGLRATRTIVEKQVEKIIDRPVYRVDCLDPDGLQLIEAARIGKAAPGSAATAVPTADAP